MTTEALREQITDLVYNFAYRLKKGEFIGSYVVTDQILAIPPIAWLIKLLNQTRDNCPECGGKGFFEDGLDAVGDVYTRVCQTCSGTGKVGDWRPEKLVILDKNQKLPTTYFTNQRIENVASNVQQDMLKAGFRRIKKEVRGKIDD